MRTFLLILLLPFAVQAQNWHISLKGGLVNYKGDLKQSSFGLGQSKFAWAVGARYDLSEHLIARTFFNFGSLQGNDAKNKSTSLQQRNLNFKAKLREWELGLQYSIFNLNDKWWTPYVFVGGSVFSAKPYTTDNTGNKVFLQPLSTEGQGFTTGRNPYKTTQFAIPFGFGGEYLVTEDIRVGVEFGYHKTFTDYIDDVSTTYVDATTLAANKGTQAVNLAYRGTGSYPAAGSLRGNSKYKDAFYYMQFIVTIRPFVDQYQRTSGLPKFKKPKRVGCPGSNGF